MKTQFKRMLTTFFALESVLCGFAYDKRAMLSELSRVYLCQDDALENKVIFAYENIVKINGRIETTEEYAKLMRTIEYCSVMGIKSGYTDFENEILVVKGLGLRIAVESKLLPDHRVPDEEIIRLLDDGAQNGEIDAFTLLGFMLINGIAVEKDTPRALRLLQKGVRWNNIDCALMYLYYQGATEENLAAVKAICQYQSSKDLFKALETEYPLFHVCKPLREVTLTAKYFSTYPEAKKRYDAQVARIAYSDVLSFADKTKVLYTQSRTLLGIANTLPIGDVFRGEYYADHDLFDTLLLKREKEWKRIWVRLGSLDMRKESVYKPMLLVCPDEFVLEMYKRVIARIYDGTVTTLDAGSLSTASISATTDNYLLDAVADSRDMHALILINNVENLSPHLAGDFARHLSPMFTSEFCVNNAGGISLDLSGTVQVLFSEGDVGNDLASACDVIELSPVRENEKQTVLDFLVAKWSTKCNVILELSEAAINKLHKYNATEMELLVSELSFYIKAEALAGKTQIIDEKLVEDCAERRVPAKSVLGF